MINLSTKDTALLIGTIVLVIATIAIAIYGANQPLVLPEENTLPTRHELYEDQPPE